MPVAHGGVGNEQLLLVAHPVGDGLGAKIIQNIARAGGHISCRFYRRARRLHICRRARTACGFGMTVDGDISDIGQDFRGAVTTFGEFEQVRRLVNELGMVFVVQERRMLQQVFDKRDVGRHTANTELSQGTVHPRNRHLRCGRTGGYFGQEAVVIARDHRAGIRRATIQSNARASGRTVHLDAPVIRDKVILRVFGRDAALQRMTVQFHVVLRCTARGLDQRFAFGDQNLGAHNVDARNFFCHRMLDLHTRVHFDKEEFAAVHIH